LGFVSEDLISQNQTAFIKGRYILESVVAAHEIIPDVAHSAQSGFIFKLDYKKAYDKVNRDLCLRCWKAGALVPGGLRLLDLF
jgi:SAM-dependent MidA family methyltransferase